jgi:hypothetical protein
MSYMNEIDAARLDVETVANYLHTNPGVEFDEAVIILEQEKRVRINAELRSAGIDPEKLDMDFIMGEIEEYENDLPKHRRIDEVTAILLLVSGVDLDAAEHVEAFIEKSRKETGHTMSPADAIDFLIGQGEID